MPSSASQAFERREDAFADESRIQDAAVEEHVRRTGEAARAAPHLAVFGGGGLLAEEARHVPGDGGIGGVGQAELLKSDAALAGGHVVAADRRAGSLRRAPARYRTRSSDALIVPPTRPVPLPRIVTGCSLAFESGSSSFSLATRQFAQSCWCWRLSMRVPFSREPLRDHAGEREIDVIAAEQDVLADRDAARATARRRFRSRRSG